MRDMRLLIRQLADQGITVLLSSHLLTEVEEVCNRVAIIRSGRIVYEGTIAELRASAATQRYRLRTTDVEHARRVLLDHRGVSDVAIESGDLRFSADEHTVVELSRVLVADGLGISALVPETATLESIFFQLTEEEQPDAEAVA
jgi:ABC-2 type transport system ATP-binding protein